MEKPNWKDSILLDLNGYLERCTIHQSFSELVNGTFLGKGVFANIIKLRICRFDHPRIFTMVISPKTMSIQEPHNTDV